METRNPEYQGSWGLPLLSQQGSPCNVPIVSPVALPKLAICNFIRISGINLNLRRNAIIFNVLLCLRTNYTGFLPRTRRLLTKNATTLWLVFRP